MRHQRLSDLIRRQLADLFIKAVYDPRLKRVTVTRVQMSPDLKQANVFYTIFDNDQSAEVQKTLEKSTGYFRYQLAQLLDLKYIPKIRFLYDAALIKANRLSDLINQIEIEDKDKDKEP